MEYATKVIGDKGGKETQCYPYASVEGNDNIQNLYITYHILIGVRNLMV